MTAKDGYVWFLPFWLVTDWNMGNSTKQLNLTCTESEMDEILNGHFSMSHEQFADDNVLMQENITVSEWKNNFTSNGAHKFNSSYVGFVYDGVWTYAYALQKLLEQSKEYVRTLNAKETLNRLKRIIENTSFDGLSGHIEFDDGGTRATNINLMQWINGNYSHVGNYNLNFDKNSTMGKRSVTGGNLLLNETNIKWFTVDGDRPTDGSIICKFEGIANLLHLDCNSTGYMIITLSCIIFVACLSLLSFKFWKHRYNQKLKESAKLMRNFGIDLLSMSSMPANTLDKWNVDKDRVVINRRLGEGQFGTVYGGEAQIGDNGWTAVAVKTLKSGSSIENRLDFLSEAEAMKRFDHVNIVKLLGVCLQTEPIYAIMEFMLYGDLKTFLLARRHLVNGKITDDSDVSPKRLTMMVLDVARALSYLADMKYVHRDVASRNCLVSAQRVIKLGDFGMARSIYDNDYYRFKRRGLLPVRWMAPETLTDNIFTPASDVWSFGVLLYEVITFGSFPYQGLSDVQVFEHLKNGNKLKVPNGVKPQLQGLMNACWTQPYKIRPSACEIAHFISNYPKLVTPHLDVPLASVQPEQDANDLIPELRRMSCEIKDVERVENVCSDDEKLRMPKGITLTDFRGPDHEDDFHAFLQRRNSNTMYNPIEPLLRFDNDYSQNNDALSMRYVPMCGYRRTDLTIESNNTPL